jgi:carbon starvation protein
MSSLWIVICSLAAFAISYRYYGAFLAARVFVLDTNRPTPAYTNQDGVDYHPTNKWVLFGHHFAAISGAGPLIGPVLAAQWGFLPGLSWILVGSCLGGAVHDLVVLTMSVRQNGVSLPELAKLHLGPSGHVAASIATLFALIAVLASTAVVVVNSLAHSAWSVFTILVTIVAALLTALWMYRLRPGKIVEATLAGVVLVLLGVFSGAPFAASVWGSSLVFTKPALSILLPVYTLLASILPVWLLMCPRDYLSSYMKIGVMLVLAVGILLVNPELRMPAITPFLSGGTIIKGSVWPFLFITIMCGAVSGWHSLVSSGTTPKMLNRETDALFIGYGAMLTEGFVAVLVLVAACALHPGDYFAINMPRDNAGQRATYMKFVEQHSSSPAFDPRPRDLDLLQTEIKENLVGRTGGGVTLAVGVADIFSRLPGMRTMASYWYHFIIMFEVLFILTLLETGTRVGRYIVHDMIRIVRPSKKPTGRYDWTMNIVTSTIVCLCWGYLLYTGTLDSLWVLFGIANQLLAAIALAVGTGWILDKAPRKIYALTTALPFGFLIITASTATVERIFDWAAVIPAIPAEEPARLILQYLLIIMSVVLISSTLWITGLLFLRWRKVML